MRIIELHAENVKGIKAVDISPDPHFQQISGKNGQGKTSILDAIWLAVQNKAANKANPNVIRNGESDAMVELVLDDYVVKRFWKRDGEDKITTRLAIETREGHNVKGPQSLLDGFIDGLSFDPMQFIQGAESPQGQRRQRQMLIDAFSLADQLAEHDAIITKESDDRRELKRKQKDLETELKTIAVPTDSDPTEEASSGDLINEQRQLNDRMTGHAKAVDIITECDRQIAELQKRKADAEKSICTEHELLAMVNREDKITEELDNLGTRNDRARNVKRYHALRAEADRLGADIQLCTDKIELAKLNKDEILEAVDLPIDGLEIGEDGIYFDGVPFMQRSDAEKLRVAMAVAMAANPDLRVIRITNGSLIDEDGMKLLREVAEQQDYQIWVEVVDGTGKVGVYIEEGEVKATNL